MGTLLSELQYVLHVLVLHWVIGFLEEYSCLSNTGDEDLKQIH